MKIPVAVAAALLLSMTPGLRADGLTLGDAIRMAREHSYALKRVDAEQRAAAAELSAAQKGRLPVLSAEAYANYQSEIAHLDVSFAGFSFQRDIGTKERYQFDTRLSVPLYTGGKITAAINQARSYTDYAAAIRDATDQQLVLATRIAYFALAAAEQREAAAEAAGTRAGILESDVASMYDAGVADSVDLLEVDHTLTAAELQYRQARIDRRQAAIELAMLLGVDPSEEMTLSPLPDAPEAQPSATAVVSPDKPELKAGKAMVSLQKAAVRMAQSSLLPTLAVGGGYHYGKPNIDIFGNTWNDNFTVAASLVWSFNIGNQAGAKVAASKHRHTAAVQEYDRTAERLDKEAQLARERLTLAWEQYQLATRDLDTRRATYRLSRARHQDGALSTNRLLELEAALTESEARHATALAAYYQAQSVYWYTIGSKRLEEGI